MNKVKLKTDESGICKEFKINDIPFGENVTKLEIIIEPLKPAKVIMEFTSEVDIELENAEIKKQIQKNLH